MAIAFSSNTEIPDSTEAVWATLTDWTLAPRWMPSVDAVSADGPLNAGTRLNFEARGRTRPSVVQSIDPGTSLTLRSVQGGVTADYTYSLRSLAEHRTALSLQAECRTRGVWRIAGPILRVLMKRSDSRQLDDLRALMIDQSNT